MNLLHALGKVLGNHPETDFSVSLARDVRAKKKAWWDGVKRQNNLPSTGKYKLVLDGADAGTIKDKRTGHAITATPRTLWAAVHRNTRQSRVFDTEADARRYTGGSSEWSVAPVTS